MSLLAEVVAWLREAQVPHCLIGAAALAVHGAARSTQDDDLLVVDRRVLGSEFWGPLTPSLVRTIRGDHDDPLAGAVRLQRAGERAVDVVVGRWIWQRDAIERATAGRRLPGCDVAVADPADLVLLKLDAAGPQDRLDVETLLSILGPSLAQEVERRLPALPAALRREWARSQGPA